MSSFFRRLFGKRAETQSREHTPTLATPLSSSDRSNPHTLTGPGQHALQSQPSPPQSLTHSPDLLHEQVTPVPDHEQVTALFDSWQHISQVPKSVCLLYSCPIICLSLSLSLYLCLYLCLSSFPLLSRLVVSSLTPKNILIRPFGLPLSLAFLIYSIHYLLQEFATALIPFAVEFERVYEIQNDVDAEWTFCCREMNMPAIADSSSSGCGTNQVTFALQHIRHDVMFVKQLCKRFSDFCVKVDSALAGLFANPSPDLFAHLPSPVVIRMMAAVSKFPSNVAVLHQCKMLKWLTDLQRILVKRYRSFYDHHDMQQFEASVTLKHFLEHTIAYSFQVCDAVIDATHALQHTLPTEIQDPEYMGMLTKLFCHFQAYFTASHRQIEPDSKQPQQSDSRSSTNILDATSFELLHSLLANLQLVLSHDTGMHSLFKETGGVEPLIGLLGWTPTDSLSGSTARTIPDVSPREEKEIRFELQLQSLCALLQLACSQPDLTDYVHLAGGFEKLVEFVLWTHATFGDDDSDTVPEHPLSSNPVNANANANNVVDEHKLPSTIPFQQQHNPTASSDTSCDSKAQHCLSPTDSSTFQSTWDETEADVLSEIGGSEPLFPSAIPMQDNLDISSAPAECSDQLAFGFHESQLSPHNKLRHIYDLLAQLCLSPGHLDDGHTGDSRNARTDIQYFSGVRNSYAAGQTMSRAGADQQPFVPFVHQGGASLRLLARPVMNIDLVPLEYRIIQVVMDVFDDTFAADTELNIDVRASMQFGRFAVQRCTLNLLATILKARPSLIEFCTECRMYDVLLSNYFYFCNEPSPATAMSKAAAESQSPNRAELDENPPCATSQRQLQQQVLMFLRFAATINNSPCTELVQYLCSVLEHRYLDDQVVIDMSQTLISIVRHRRRKLQLAFVQTESLPTLIRIVSTHQKCALENSPNDQQRPLLHEARFSILKFFDYLLSSREMRLHVMQGFYAVNVIFSLIREPPPLRTFALRLTTDLILCIGPKLKLRPDEADFLGGVPQSEHGAFVLALQKAKAQLISKYVETLPQVLNERPVAFALLEGIRRTLRFNTKYHQEMFRSAQCFIHIFNLLSHMSSTDHKDSGHSSISSGASTTAASASASASADSSESTLHPGTILCTHVLQTFGALLRNNRHSREYFRKEIGYDQLKRLLLRAEQNKPSRELYAALFDVMVEGEFDVDQHFTIRNPNIIDVMFWMLPSCNLAHQVEFLHVFIAICSRSVLNQSHCCRPGHAVIDQLLDIFGKTPHVDVIHAPEQRDVLRMTMLQLIELVGAHSISVRQLKRILALMRSEPISLQHALPPAFPINIDADSSADDSSFHGRSPSITPAESGTLLRGLASNAASRALNSSEMTIKVRSRYTTSLLRAIQNMCLTEGPSSFFYFDGIRSGLHVLGRDKWSSLGYSFSTWLRIESFEHPLHARSDVKLQSHAPRLFSFTNDHTRGIDCYFVNGQLTMEIDSGKNRVHVHTFHNVKLECKRWYHIAISHSVRTFSPGDISLYIDGELVDIAKGVRYPMCDTGFKYCCVATDRKKRALFAEMGPFYAFGTALNSAQVSSMYERGPSYMFAFEQSGSSMASSMVLAYNAKARNGDVYLDSTPHALSDHSPASSAKHAKGLPGTHQCITRHVNDVIHCLGGIRVLFPLLSQLDYPIKLYEPEALLEVDDAKGGYKLAEVDADAVTRPDSPIAVVPELSRDESPNNVRLSFLRHRKLSDVSVTSLNSPSNASSFGSANNSVVVSYDADPQFIVSIFQVLRQMLQNNAINQAFMVQSQGFHVIATVLERVSPLHFSREFVEEVDLLVDSQAFDVALFQPAFNSLLMNFRLWIYADPSVQREWLRTLVQTLDQQPPSFSRDTLGIQSILDDLRTYAWFLQEEHSQITVQTLYHPITGTVIGRRASAEMIVEIRSCLLRVLQVAMQDNIRLEETTAIVHYIESCDDDAQVCDVLRLLSRMLNSQTARIVKQLNTLQDTSSMPTGAVSTDRAAMASGSPKGPQTTTRLGIEMFVTLLISPNVDVRETSLQCIGKMLRHGVDISPLLDAFFCAMYRNLAEYPLTPGAYRALFSIMLSEDIPGRYAFHLDETQTILYPQMLGIIFKLMRNTTSMELNQQIMQDMFFLMSNPVNEALFLEQFGWQQWLLDIIILDMVEVHPLNEHVAPTPGTRLDPSQLSVTIHDADGVPANTPAPAADDETLELAKIVVVDYAKKLLENLLIHSMRTADGWHAYEVTLAWMLWLGSERQTNVLSVLRRLYDHLCRRIEHEFDLLAENDAAILVRNAYQVAQSTQDCLLSRLRVLSGVYQRRLVTTPSHKYRRVQTNHATNAPSSAADAIFSSASAVLSSNAPVDADDVNATVREELLDVWPLVHSVIELNQYVYRNLPKDLSVFSVLQQRTHLPSKSKSRHSGSYAHLSAARRPDSKESAGVLGSPGLGPYPLHASILQDHALTLLDIIHRVALCCSTGTDVVLFASSPCERYLHFLLHEAVKHHGAMHQLDAVSSLEKFANAALHKANTANVVAAAMSPTSSDVSQSRGDGDSDDSDNDTLASMIATPPMRSELICGLMNTVLSILERVQQQFNKLTKSKRSTGTAIVPGRIASVSREQHMDQLWNNTCSALLTLRELVQLNQHMMSVTHDSFQKPGAPAAGTSSTAQEAQLVLQTLPSPATNLVTKSASASSNDSEISGFLAEFAIPALDRYSFGEHKLHIGSDADAGAADADPESDPDADTGNSVSSEVCIVAGIEIAHEWLSKWCQVFLVSPEWNRVRKRVKAFIVDVDVAQAARCNNNSRRLEHVMSRVHRRQVHADDWQDVVYDDSYALSTQVVNWHRQRESQRREQIEATRARIQRRIIRTWRSMYVELTNERGPWSTKTIDDIATAQGEKVYWQLDPTEDRLRRRMKLMVNMYGHDHKSASADVTPLPDKQSSFVSTMLQQANSTLSNSPETSALLRTALQLSNEQESDTKIEDHDLLDDDDWDVLGIDEAEVDAKEVVSNEEETVLQCASRMVTASLVTVGTLTLTNSYLYFEVKESVSHDKKVVDVTEDGLYASLSKDQTWSLADIRGLHFRRYQLRRIAMEVFFTDHTNAFLVFESEDARNDMYHRILRQRPSNLRPQNVFSSTPATAIRKSGLTEAWQRRRISNFEYLMHLNTIAGRTYNDLAQYPVFPWVIADYTSQKLHLHDQSKWKKTYRDLTKPMGAQNPTRLETYVNRYKMLGDDPNMPRFHYGTHYSSAGNVLYYLIRMEPFTTQAIVLQSGKFDHADRLFDSIPATWHGCVNNAADVKELIPEFFYLSEFLRNANNFHMGFKQSNRERVHDAILPPWAPTPEAFVRINREALESEYVSQHLHHWVDLIFGYKQRGQAAVDAHNVFFHLTYEGAVDIDKIEDPGLREATVAQIEHFGQTPSQLFKTPHPARFPEDDVIPCIFHRLGDLKLYVREQITKVTPTRHSSASAAAAAAAAAAGDANSATMSGTVLTNDVMLGQHVPLLFIHTSPDRIITAGLDRVVHVHRWRNSTPEYVPPFSFEPDRKAYSGKPRKFGAHFAPNLRIQPNFFAVTRDNRYMLSCGHWDSSVKCTAIDGCTVVQSLVQHKDIVTCLALSTDGETLVTGSKDTTVMVWNVHRSIKSGGLIEHTPRHVLYGHDDEVTCVAVSTDLDVVVSCSRDGTIIVHTCRDGQYVRTMCPTGLAPLRWVGVSSEGDVLVHDTDQRLHLYTINGRHLKSIDNSERITAFLISKDGSYLVTGSSASRERHVLTIRRMHDLVVMQRFQRHAPSGIRCIATTPDEQHLLVGLLSGKVLIYALDAGYLRKRTLKKLASLGF
jgi:Beige/BEACH domain/Neurobeachin beta propeller domain/Neurobeachin/BDCP, DUF4704 alpha solenoid region/Neurobeachin alpha solenoid region/PH domain associated with Beige/BEACH